MREPIYIPDDDEEEDDEPEFPIEVPLPEEEPEEIAAQ